MCQGCAYYSSQSQWRDAMLLEDALSSGDGYLRSHSRIAQFGGIWVCLLVFVIDGRV